MKETQTFRYKNTSTVKDVILTELLIEIIYFTTHLYLTTTQGITVQKFCSEKRKKKHFKFILHFWLPEIITDKRKE